MTIIALELDDKVYQELKEIAGTLNLSPEQMINEIIKNYLRAEKTSRIRREGKG